MNETINEALPVFDQLESRDEAFNVYQCAIPYLDMPS